MTAPTCLCGCERPLLDGYVTAACVRKTGEQLRQVADMTPAARDIAHGLSRRGGGGASGKPGSRLPLDLAATAKLDGISNTVTGWARHVSESRGIELPEPPIELPGLMIGPLCRTRYDCTHDSCKIMRDGDEWGWDMIVVAARFLGEHLEWWRHRLEVDEFMRDVAAAARIVGGIARGPAPQTFLGPCGAALVDWEAGDDAAAVGTCDGDVYARDGAPVGRCRSCGAEVSTAERRAWLDGEVRSRAFRAAEIAGAYDIKVNTIRSWALRGLLTAHGYDRDGRPLYNVGEVLDLAAADAARRETARAERARRKERAA